MLVALFKDWLRESEHAALHRCCKPWLGHERDEMLTERDSLEHHESWAGALDHGSQGQEGGAEESGKEEWEEGERV